MFQLQIFWIMKTLLIGVHFSSDLSWYLLLKLMNLLQKHRFLGEFRGAMSLTIKQ